MAEKGKEREKCEPGKVPIRKIVELSSRSG